MNDVLARRAKVIADIALYRAVEAGSETNSPWDQPGGIGTPVELRDPTASVETGNNTASGPLSACVGGSGNTASGQYSSCLGGLTNAASNLNATCLGGTQNTASGGASACIGGLGNVASGPSSLTLACYLSNATGTTAVVLGGDENNATNLGAATLGGAGNIASGEWSACVGGENAAAIREAQLSHGSANLGTSGHVQQSWLELWGTTPGVAVGESAALGWGGGPTTLFPLENGKAYVLTLDAIVGAGTTNIRQAFKIFVCAGCQAGIATIDEQSVLSQIGNAGGASWTILVGTDGANNLTFTFKTGTTQAQCAVTMAMNWAEIAYPFPAA
jgi:hypothetical protein